MLSWSRRTRRAQGPKRAMKMRRPFHRDPSRDQGGGLLEGQGLELIQRFSSRMVNLPLLLSLRPDRDPGLNELLARKLHRSPLLARLHQAPNPMSRCRKMFLLRNHETISMLKRHEPLANGAEQTMRKRTGRGGPLHG